MDERVLKCEVHFVSSQGSEDSPELPGNRASN